MNQRAHISVCCVLDPDAETFEAWQILLSTLRAIYTPQLISFLHQKRKGKNDNIGRTTWKWENQREKLMHIKYILDKKKKKPLI